MDESPNPGENEDPGRDWAIFRHPDKKGLPGASPGRWLEMLLVTKLELLTRHSHRTQEYVIYGPQIYITGSSEVTGARIALYLLTWR
jgi:hypothetical protein